MAVAKLKSGNREQTIARLAQDFGKPLKGIPKIVENLLQVYGDAVKESRVAGRPLSFRVEVGPKGKTVWTLMQEAAIAGEAISKKQSGDHISLRYALTAARARGRILAAELLSAPDMLNADAFAQALGVTRVTVNTRRQNGQVLGLDGTKRGYRFPVWQMDSEGRPYAELAELHQRLGGPWAVYRFLVQTHGELNGLTGLEALRRGKSKAVLKAAESVGRDFQ